MPQFACAAQLDLTPADNTELARQSPRASSVRYWRKADIRLIGVNDRF
jgi:hypothetical protein